MKSRANLSFVCLSLLCAACGGGDGGTSSRVDPGDPSDGPAGDDTVGSDDGPRASEPDGVSSDDDSDVDASDDDPDEAEVEAEPEPSGEDVEQEPSGGDDDMSGDLGVDPTANPASGGAASMNDDTNVTDDDVVGDDGASGGSSAAPDDDTTMLEPSSDELPPSAADDLATASGCAGVFNPDQLLELRLELAPSDWAAVLADTSYANVVSAQFSCNEEAPITVGVRRKRSGGQNKVGLKIDANEFVSEQTWYGLKKLSLENGVSEGDESDGTEVRAYIAEYLAWRIMVLSQTISSRATFVNLHVNGDVVGVYLNVEQVDKRFLDDRLGDDEGWLYKKSGGVGDGLKTHESDGLENPYDDYFCFWANGNGCPVPSEETLAAELPAELDIPQFLRFGAVNAFIANPDGPLFKDNNYYHYDWVGGRSYIPWDLDTTMKDSPSLFSASGGGKGSAFADVLLTNWRQDYEAILVDLVQNKTPVATIYDELERAERVAGAAFAGDVYVEGTAAEAVVALQEYWAGRVVDVEAELGL